MSKQMPATDILTIRIPRDLGRRLRREARRQRRSPSAVARDVLLVHLGAGEDDALAAEARRQSLLVKRRQSERETLDWIGDIADVTGWK